METTRDFAAETLQFLQEGDKFITLSSKKEIVLMLGNTGSGKSTLTQFIAGNNDQMFSKYVEDSDVFIITDTFNRISDATVTSRTIFPELVVDEKTDVAFYDCPGFKDTRNASMDIAAAYFINKVINHAESVKIVFAVNFTSLRQGGNRFDLFDLVKHAVKLIKDISKFKNSIALIVTKVDTTRDDAITIRGLGNFIKKSRTEISELLATDIDLKTKVLSFIDIILHQRNDKYTKIGLFHTPNEEGRISTLRTLQEGKLGLTNIINKEIEYTNIDQTDFAYTISPESINYVHTITEKILDNIVSTAKQFKESLENVIVNKIKLSNNIQELHDSFSKAHNDLSVILSETVDKYSLPSELFTKIENSLTSNNFILPNSIILDIIKYSNQINFFQLFSSIDTRPMAWVHFVIEAKDALRDTEIWYKFLAKLHNRFSEYDIQKYRTRYDVIKIENWGEEGKENGIDINEQNIDTFFAKIKNYNIPHYDKIAQNKIKSFKIPHLNYVLKSALQNDFTFSIQSPKTYVAYGTYLILSQVVDAALSKNCFTIKVIASHTVFIDKNINLIGFEEKYYELIIIAPTWYVEGTVLINLNGSAGIAHGQVANVGHYGSGNGDNGRPGFPGQQGGSFFGIGLKYVNDKNLTITANGGNGGVGQQGGTGGEGRQGSNINFSSLHFDQWGDHGFPYSKFSSYNYGVTSHGTKKSSTSGWRYEVTTYTISGTNGSVGGNGGHGGVGGFGGKKGKINIISINKIITANQNAEDGANGLSGSGGNGGSGGVHGNSCTAILEHKSPRTIFNDVTDHTRLFDENYRSRGSASSGQRGTNGANTLGLKIPTFTAHEEIYIKAINNYKNLAISQKVNNKLLQNSTLELLNFLNTSKTVNEAFKLSDYIEELKLLETIYNESKVKQIFSTFYQQYMKRLTDFTSNSTHEGDQRKVLSYLYSATLSKIMYLTAENNPTIIVDIRGYLHFIKSNFSDLKNLEDMNTIKENISRHRSEFKDRLNSKVKECNELTKDLTNEINAIVKESDIHTTAILAEIENKQKEVENNSVELEKLKTELEERTSTRLTLGILQTFGKATTLLGDYGGAISSAIDSTVMLADSSISNPSLSRVKPVEIQAGMNYVLQEIDISFTLSASEHIEKFKSNIDMLYKDFSSYPPGTVDETIVVIEKVKHELKDINLNSNKLYTKIALLQEQVDTEMLRLLHFLQDKQIQLIAAEQKLTESTEKIEDSTITPDVENVQDLTEAIHEEKKIRNSRSIPDTVATSAAAPKGKSHENEIALLKAYSGISQAAITTINKYKADQAEISVVDSSLSKNNENLGKIKKFENQIFDKLIPLMNTLKGSLNDLMENRVPAKSIAALDVAKFIIIKTLNDLKNQLRQITEGFNVQRDVLQFVDKLDNALTAQLNLYTRIQEYQDQKELADYIADIASPATQTLKLADQMLSNEVDQLHMLLRSNIVLGQFDRAVANFKQWVFPFAPLFLREFTLPENIEYGKNVTSVIESASRIIDSLSAKTTEYHLSLINNHDEYIFKEKFYSDYTSSLPFHTWKNAKYSSEIAELLSGNQVFFKSDILDVQSKNALKFNIIGIKARSTVESLQNDIDTVLLSYNVALTHLGNSQYRCGEKFYSIYSDRQTIEYSFMLDKKGEHLSTNRVYDKMKTGSLLLSPFATWIIQLKNRTAVNPNDLKKYKDNIDIDLVGEGQFVSDYVSICKENLEQYYPSDNLLEERNFAAAVAKLKTVKNKPVVNRNSRSNNAEVQDGVLKSSSSILSSPLNSILNFIGSTLNSIKLVIKDQFLSTASTQSITWTHKSHNNILEDNAVVNWNVNDTLILADLIVRNITKEKPVHCKVQQVNLLEAQGFALNIVKSFEELIENTSTKIDYDVVSIQSMVVKLIFSERFYDIPIVLYNSIRSKSVILDKDTFVSNIEVIVSEVLSSRFMDYEIVHNNKGKVNGNGESLLPMTGSLVAVSHMVGSGDRSCHVDFIE